MELYSSWISSAAKDLLLVSGNYYFGAGKFCFYLFTMVFYLFFTSGIFLVTC
jgi:hypothetical protein